MTITGRDLISAGIAPGPHFPSMIEAINADILAGSEPSIAIVRAKTARDHEEASIALERSERVIPLQDGVDIVINIEAENDAEEVNVASVISAMRGLVRTPTVEAAAIMPDACPAGAIPVGGVAAARNAIHPGWHSADICCSMSATNFGDADPKSVLDAVYGLTHFGPGGRKRHEEARMPADLLDRLQSGNQFLKDRKTQDQARSHLMTQGDGNHFAFVGRSEATGQTWLITHHGSRGFGAGVYKAGMAVAEEFRKEICPDLDKGHAWIPFDTDEGRAYWEALEVVRAWTKVNHDLLHDAVAEKLNADPLHKRWNPHNFVFRDEADPTLFWHAKGATPVHNPFLEDTDGTQIIPLNMAQPILFVKGGRNDRSLGFAPHGAGRNMSRTQHRNVMSGETDEAIFARETDGLDARFWCGITDISELPSAYKDADQVQKAMGKFGLAEVVDRIMPYGSIMAGDWENNAPWRKK